MREQGYQRKFESMLIDFAAPQTGADTYRLMNSQIHC